MKTQTLIAAFAMTLATAAVVAPAAHAAAATPAPAPAAAPATTPAPAAKPMHHTTKTAAHHTATHGKAKPVDSGDAAVERLNQQQLDKAK